MNPITHRNDWGRTSVVLIPNQVPETTRLHSVIFSPEGGI